MRPHWGGRGGRRSRGGGPPRAPLLMPPIQERFPLGARPSVDMICGKAERAVRRVKPINLVGRAEEKNQSLFHRSGARFVLIREEGVGRSARRRHDVSQNGAECLECLHGALFAGGLGTEHYLDLPGRMGVQVGSTKEYDDVVTTGLFGATTAVAVNGTNKIEKVQRAESGGVRPLNRDTEVSGGANSPQSVRGVRQATDSALPPHWQREDRFWTRSMKV